MQPYRLVLISLMGFPLAFMAAGCATGPRSNREEEEQIRQVERERLRSLVDADSVTARRLHTDDFQLINPLGMPITKEEYLGEIESGQLDYRAWDPARLVHRGPMYHTNLYERRGEQWQVVWSQGHRA